MIFDDQSEQFLAYQQSIEGSDLDLIPLPMINYTKQSMEGLIQMPMAALPDSNPFGPYSNVFDSTYPGSNLIVNSGHNSPDYGSDSDFGYAVDQVHQTTYHPTTSVIEYASMPQPTSVNAQASRKRKASPDQEYLEVKPAKKVAGGPLQVREAKVEFHNVENPTSLYPTYTPAPARPIYVNTPAQIKSPRPGHQYSTSSASQVSLAAPSPHTPAWSPSFTTVKTEPSPRPPMTPASRPASTSSPYISSQVRLVRTSTIPQQSSPSVAAAMGNVHSHGFNPYAYPHKATLRLNGDLDAVALKWTEDELEARRKLIVFDRSQVGSTIDATFKTVPPQEWSRSDITINCIWWKEKKEAFVTSVDTIALLEQLIAVRFTVEEKNRIRRNLEGFRPLTVSKAKSESEDFFKVIMGFPNPKPRNIEKDVKVFPWKILAHALKKIISKYSASYASTSAMITPAASVYASNEPSIEYPSEVPHSQTLLSNAPQNYNMSMPGYEHGIVVSSMPASTNMASNELGLQVPTINTQYEMVPQTLMYAPGPMPTSTPMGYHTHQTAPHSAGPTHNMAPNWSYAPAMPDTSRYMMPYSAPPSAHPYGHIETANLSHAAGYQLMHR